MVSHDGVVREAYESQLPRMAGTVAAVWQLALLIPVLIYLPDYRQPAVPVAVWLGVLAAAGWPGPRARASGLRGAGAHAAVAVAVAEAAAGSEDRRGRLALLEADVLPLLRGIADGTLDPADSQVQERCARHAARLRRALADQARGGAGLLAELEPALRAAQARGLPVEVQVVGDPGDPVREVAGAALAAVDSIMAVLPRHPVVLTVLGSGSETELYVTFDRPPRATPDVAALGRNVPALARWCASVDVSDTGAGCLHVRWRYAAPAAGRSWRAAAQ